VKLTTHFRVLPRLRKRGVIPPLPHMSSWRGALVEHRGNFTFALLPPPYSYVNIYFIPHPQWYAQITLPTIQRADAPWLYSYCSILPSISHCVWLTRSLQGVEL